MLISVRNGETGPNPYRSGNRAVITDEAFRNVIADDSLIEEVMKRRWCFLTDEVWDAIGLPREDVDNRLPKEVENEAEAEHSLSI